MNIYVCGNPLVKEDALPLKLLPRLQKLHPDIKFIDFDPTEDLPKQEELVFIDTVINAKDINVYHNIDDFVQHKALSLHDFDLGLNLKLAKKMGWLAKVTIIGVPQGINPDGAVKKISRVIQSLT